MHDRKLRRTPGLLQAVKDANMFGEFYEVAAKDLLLNRCSRCNQEYAAFRKRRI